MVWHCAHGAVVGMWFAGLPAPVTLVANVGVVMWQLPQSPLVGCLASSAAEGRESPAVVPLLGSIPT